MKMLTIGHSYVIGMNRAVVREVARCGEFDITVAAPTSFHGDLRPLTIDPEPPDSPLKVVGLKTRGSRSIHTFQYDWPELKALIEDGKFDLVHAWEEPYIFSGYQIARAVGSTRSKFLFRTAQSIVKWYPPPFGWFERQCVSGAHSWVAGGSLVHQAMLKRGYPAAKGHVVTLGVDTNQFKPISPTEKIALQKQLQLSHPVIGFVGRLCADKGLNVLMNALDLIGNTQPWSLALFGSGPLRSKIESWAKLRGWQDRVLIRLVKHEEMPRYIGAFDVMVAPSQTTPHWREQFGRMLIEAFASGVPVIGSDSGEIPHVLADAGLIVPEKNIKAWASAISLLTKDADLRRNLAAKGRERVHCYSVPTVSKQWAALYKKTLGVDRILRTRNVKLRRRLVTIGHSYSVALNRRLAHEMAEHGGGDWEIVAVAPQRVRGDLRSIDFEPAEIEACGSIAISSYLSSKPHLMYYGSELRQILSRGWDLIHGWQEPYVLTGAQIARLSPPKTPFVFYTHQNISKVYPPPFSLFEQYCLDRCAAWIAGGETSTNTLLRRGYGRRPHTTLPLGVDTNVFAPKPESRAAIWDSLGWTANGPPVVGFLGRFVAEKGLKMLCDSLDRAHEPFRALFVGGGPLEKELKEWSKRYPRRVRVVTGVRHDRVPCYLNAMDMVCAPSQTTNRWREQFGRMLIEAFACGVPVIASNSGEIPHVVGDAGIIVDEKNSEELASALDGLLGDGAARRQLSQKGLDRAQRLFSWPRIAKDHLTFFSECLDRSTSCTQ